jgi:hypothetical protein
MNRIDAHGEAVVRLFNAHTGKLVHEAVQRNSLNLDYLSEVRSSVFGLSSALTVYLTDFGYPSPENGLIIPMGNPLGNGKYNTGSSGFYQGAWSAANALLNQQQDGLTTHRFAWEFTPSQVVGTLRSLYLFFDSYGSHVPSIRRPAITYKGTPYWSIGSKLIDVVSKTATQYYVADYYTKEAVLHSKQNTLTMTGIARDIDTGHIFIYDGSAKKLYEYESEDTDFVADNVLAEYPCTQAYVGKGLVRGDYVYFASGSADPVSSSAAAPSGANIYLFRHAYKQDSTPELIETIAAAGTGASSITSASPCAFIDDYLIYYAVTSNQYKCPVIRIVGETAKLGFSGYYPYSSTTSVMRLTPDTQLLISGKGENETMGYLAPMALSHLLLDEPIEKDDQHSLSVAYTLTIQE